MPKRFIILPAIVAVLGLVLIGPLFHLAWPFFDYFVVVRIRGTFRAHENLPSVTVVSGRTVYCRMQYCDFRFPLPEGARVVRADPVTGGPDTIDGAIYVVGPDGGPVKMRAYAEFLEKNHFDATPTDGTGCESCTNVPDVPFISGGKVIHYPIFNEFGAGSSSQDGGGIQVEAQDRVTKIRFSYFGDL
jgi:hypothetical protein